jgi:hypothetical protein
VDAVSGQWQDYEVLDNVSTAKKPDKTHETSNKNL